MKRALIALAALGALSGCGIFKGDGKPKTPVLGDRIAVLTSENSAEVDPTLADQPIAIPEAAANADWPQPGGNAAKNIGHVAVGTALGEVWSTRIKGSTKKVRLGATPVIADGKVFVVDTDATLHAFSASNGAKLWTAELGVDGRESRSNFGGGVSYDNGRVFATTGVGDAFGLDAATGKQIWKIRPAGPLRGSPTVANDNVYFLSQDNQIFAVSAADGKVQWNEAATLETASVFGVAAPAFAQGTVVAGFSSGELTAYRYENGRAVWQDALSRTSITTSVSSISDIDASPVIDGGRVYAIGEGGRMIATDLISGQRIWELNVAGMSTPAVAGDWAFVVTNDAKLMAIQRNTGKVRWLTQLQRWKNEKKKSGPTIWKGPILAGNRLILVNNLGQMLNVAHETGVQGNGVKLGDGVSLPPVVAGGTLYLLTDNGRLSAWR